MDALVRPARAAALGWGALAVASVCVPAVGTALVAAAPLHQLTAVCACFAAGYGLTFVPGRVQRTVLTGLVGAALVFAACPGPQVLRLVAGALTAVAAGAAASTLQRYYSFALLCGGVLGALVLLDEVRTRHAVSHGGASQGV